MHEQVPLHHLDPGKEFDANFFKLVSSVVSGVGVSALFAMKALN